MRILPFVALAILLLGTATLFAEPEEAESDFTLGLSEPFEVGEETAEVLVKALGAKSSWRVRIDATFLRIEAPAVDGILGEHRPDRKGSARVIPEALALRLVRAARGSGAIRSEPPPPLVLYDRQAGRLSATGIHTYLQDYGVEVGMSAPVYVPIVGRIEDGTRLDVSPRRDGKRLLLDLDVVWAALFRPVPRFEATLTDKPEPVTIQLPELRLTQLVKRVELPATGGYVLAGNGTVWDGESLRLVVVEAKATKR